MIRVRILYIRTTEARFLRGKWRVKRDEITTAQDFVTKVASVSSTTGQPYRIQFADGHEVSSGDYLRAVLQKLEESS